MIKHNKKNLNQQQISYARSMRGGMLVEMLMSVAIAAVAIPFLFKYQQNAITRAENIAITQKMSLIQSALEQYIVENREKLVATVGRNIVRLEMSDLAPFGLPDDVLESGDKYQLRILKSPDATGTAALQGIIVMSTDDMTALRTRELVSMGAGDVGFIEGNTAYGTFGTWHAYTADMGINITDGIIEKTAVNRDNVLYLWRVPSDDATDATMQSALNLGEHDIENATFISTKSARFEEVLKLGATAASTTIFRNRTVLDKKYQSTTATVSGALASDSRSMEIGGTLIIPDMGKFSAFNANNLWVTNLNLSGLSIISDAKAPVLKVSQTLDMTSGRINAISATVGFSGSVTPRLAVSQRIEDSTNASYYWDASGKTGNFVDATFPELNHLAQLIARDTSGQNTVSYQIFNKVATNKNATVSDFMNAISEIEQRVRTKYRQLNLE